MSSLVHAQRFRAMYERRMGSPAPTVGRSRWEDTTCLREIMLSHVSTRQPKHPHEIFEAVVNDYGSCGERRLWRALAWLLEQRQVVRTRDGYRRTA